MPKSQADVMATGTSKIELWQGFRYEIKGREGDAMTELDFQEVIERFDEILDAVERGETFCIFRNGRPVALLEPHAPLRPAQTDISAHAA